MEVPYTRVTRTRSLQDAGLSTTWPTKAEQSQTTDIVILSSPNAASQATAPNVYLLLYPKPVLVRALEADPGLVRRVWDSLNRISSRIMKLEGRIYGNGLHKMEPKELANVPADMIAELLPEQIEIAASQQRLFAG